MVTLVGSNIQTKNRNDLIIILPKRHDRNNKKVINHLVSNLKTEVHNQFRHDFFSGDFPLLYWGKKWRTQETHILP